MIPQRQSMPPPHFIHFKQFELCAGLKMNVDKTKAKVLGPEAMPHDKLFGLDWTEEAFTLSVSHYPATKMIITNWITKSG